MPHSYPIGLQTELFSHDGRNCTNPETELSFDPDIPVDYIRHAA